MVAFLLRLSAGDLNDTYRDPADFAARERLRKRNSLLATTAAPKP